MSQKNLKTRLSIPNHKSRSCRSRNCYGGATRNPTNNSETTKTQMLHPQSRDSECFNTLHTNTLLAA